MGRLGRNLKHDPRSKAFPAARAGVTKSVLWAHQAPVLDQLDLGSCTGNSLAQLLNTQLFGAARNRARRSTAWLKEKDAVAFYSLGTSLDEYLSQYPPDDTGCSGLGVCKAGVRLGFLRGYTHAFGFDHFVQAVQLQPVIVGTTWYTDMFDPDSRGLVRISGAVEGGHEYLVLGIDITRSEVICLNSWGPGWGVKGRFRISFKDFKALLADEGDVTVPLTI